jgi:predicted Zn finger-like uncharacterized protein
MRLICPNCGAQYEIDNTAIPPGGRDVQCSDCQFSWFHTRRDPLILRASETEAAAAEASAPADPPPPRRRPDAQVMAVLREEALREQTARDSETGPGDVRAMVSRDSVSPRPDPVLPPAESQPARALREQPEGSASRSSAPSGRVPWPRPTPAESLAATANASTRLPDGADQPPRPDRSTQPEARIIPSELARAATPAAAVPLPGPVPQAEPRGGAWLGTIVAITGFAAAALVYAQPGPLVRNLPSLQAPVAAYVERVDAGRVWLASTVDPVLAGLRGAGD